MRLVPAAIWKIIFPAVFCSAKAAVEPSATAETMDVMTAALPDTINADTRLAKALQCMNDINSGGNAFTAMIVLTAPKKSTIITAQENTTTFPRTTMSVTVFGNTTTTVRYSSIVNEPGGTIAVGDPTINKAVPGVSSIAFEEATKNFLQNVISTTSIENPYTISVSASGPGGATAPNGDPIADTENVIRFHEESSMSQDYVLPAENPGSATPLSTENTINTVTGKTITQGQDNAVDIATTFGNAPEGLPDNIQVNPACSSECDAIPPWATVLLCLATAFFLFALVGLLFLLPYCRMFRRPTAVSSCSSPRYSV